MQDRDPIRLRHMLLYAQDAMGIAQGRSRADLDSDRGFMHALVRCIELVGEAASRLSEEARNELPQIPWRAIINMRNRLIHGYFEINLDLVWQTIQNDLPPLISQLKQIV